MVKLILLALILPPVLLYLGFFFYASAMQHWRELPLFNKVVVGLVVLVFGALDIVFRFTWGAIYYLDVNPRNGFTFSALSCYYFRDSGWRKHRAEVISNELNLIYAGHIA
jgi:hypothetical protein